MEVVNDNPSLSCLSINALCYFEKNKQTEAYEALMLECVAFYDCIDFFSLDVFFQL